MTALNSANSGAGDGEPDELIAFWMLEQLVRQDRWELTPAGRAYLRALRRRESAEATNHPDYPGYTVCAGCQGPDDGHFPDCITETYRKVRPATAAEREALIHWVKANGRVEVCEE